LKNYLPFLFIFIVFIAIQSCNSVETNCPDDSIGQFRLGFSRKVDSTTNQFIVRCVGLSDSIYNSPSEPIQVDIPVDITNDTMAIYIDFISKTDTTFEKETDLIAFTYLTHSYMQDLECGLVTEFLIKRVYYSKNHIDTAFFTNNLINSDKVNHVEIQY
jgi:hypothetical protein